MTDLLLLTIDSLRRDRFDEAHFPNSWPTFAGEFARFEDAYANGVATPISFPGPLTGRTDVGDGTLSPDAATIAERYDGYSWALTNNPHLRPERGYDRGFDDFAHRVEGSDAGAAGEGDGSNPDRGVLPRIKRSVLPRLERIGSRSKLLGALHRRYVGGGPDLAPPPGVADNVVSELRSGMEGRRGFFWAHFMDPHYPFVPQKVLDRDVETGRSMAEIAAANTRYRSGEATDADVEFLEGMYDGILGYLDRRLAGLFAWLRSEGRWEDSMVVVAADHGEAFGERGVFNHEWDADPIDPLVRVPLLVKYPGEGAGRTYDHPVGNADLFATLAAEFGWDAEVPGHVRPLTDPGPRVVLSKSNAAVRLTTGTGYAIRRRDGSTLVEGDVDEEDVRRLREASIPEVKRLPELLDRIPGEMRGDDTDDGDVQGRLDSLGYR